MSRATEIKRALKLASRYDAWVWNRVAAGEQPKLGETYRQFRAPDGPEALTVATVIASSEPLAVIAQRVRSWSAWHISAGAVGALLVQDDEGQVFVVSSWPDARTGIYHLAATVPATDRRWAKFDRWLQRAAPHVVPVYLDRRDFEGFVSVLGEHGDVDASRLTGRYRTDQSSYTRGWPNPKSARAALEEIADEVQLRTMTLSVLSTTTGEMLMRAHLRRAAGATFYSGSFTLFESVVLEKLASAADHRARMFRNRARTKGDPQLRPLEIRIGLDRFADVAATSVFLERVARYAHSDTAVLHRNPYLQISLTDYLDGSNFDLFITEADRVAIYPGYHATVGALVRLTDFLSEEFEADAVAERPAPTPVSLEDVFSPG